MSNSSSYENDSPESRGFDSVADKIYAIGIVAVSGVGGLIRKVYETGSRLGSQMLDSFGPDESKR